MKIESIMTREPICCEPSESVEKVAQLMREFDIGAIPVVSDFISRRLVGIITDRDICTVIIAEGKHPAKTAVNLYMTRTLITCSPDDNLEACEDLMKKHRVRRIPVVDRENSCVGIVALADLARVSTPERLQATIAQISTPRQARGASAVA
jgi:CBS domain-containing protein